jgi:hypothetical protein
MTTPAQEIEQRNKRGNEKLLSALSSGNAILMAGAGCSVNLGYPDWSKLIEDMATQLTPGLILTSKDVKIAAQEIWDQCTRKHNSAELFQRYVKNQFAPKRLAYTDFHCDLVRLPFAGYTTTNYDLVLEHAIIATFVGEHSGCTTVNLCTKDTRHEVLDFFRELGSGNRTTRRVLHIHGTFDHPHDIVLTQNDYERFYNDVVSDNTGTKEKKRTPDMFHRQAIWSLLATRTIVFIGFSLKDSFFADVIQVWRNDFRLIQECPHIAVMDCNSTDDIIEKDERLTALGVVPLYYETPLNNASDHTGLRNLIAEIAEQLGVRASQPSANELTKRNLELIK